jgi:trehalose 6-phosphate phosphatase
MYNDTVLPNAMESFDEFARRAAGKRVVFFLDYDGTLTPIVARPELAVLSAGMRETVTELAALSTVAIVSGRDRQDVEKLVQIDSLFYAGSHGFDIGGPRGRQLQHEEGASAIPRVERAEVELQAALQSIAGVIIERKKFSVAVHYRLVREEDLKTIKISVDEVLSRTSGLRKKDGKKVYELLPDIEWDKGKAVRWLLEKLHPGDSGVLPIYVGDDTTDEDAFRELRDSGVGIFVGASPPQTLARYALRNPGEVEAFLRRWVARG